MKLSLFKSAYLKTPTSRTEHDEAPGRRLSLVHQIVALDEEAIDRIEITQFLTEQALSEDAEAVHHLGLLKFDRKIFWTIATSKHLRSRLAALTVLAQLGEASEVQEHLFKLIPHSLGRYPQLEAFAMIESLSSLDDEIGVQGLWRMTSVGTMTAQQMAFRRILERCFVHPSLSREDLSCLEDWACLPLDILKSEVKVALTHGDLTYLKGTPPQEEKPQELIVCFGKFRDHSLQLNQLNAYPQTWKNVISYRALQDMGYYFDPTEQWGGRWDTAWPQQGPEVLRMINPPWARSALEELLSLARDHSDEEVEQSLVTSINLMSTQA